MSGRNPIQLLERITKNLEKKYVKKGKKSATFQEEIQTNSRRNPKKS